METFSSHPEGKRSASLGLLGTDLGHHDTRQPLSGASNGTYLHFSVAIFPFSRSLKRKEGNNSTREGTSAQIGCFIGRANSYTSRNVSLIQFDLGERRKLSN